MQYYHYVSKINIYSNVLPKISTSYILCFSINKALPIHKHMINKTNVIFALQLLFCYNFFYLVGCEWP